jgi:hypothetical protein
MSTAPGIAIGARLARTPSTALEQYRDDGVLARLLGAAAGRLLPLPPLLLALVGTLGVLAIAAAEGDSASDGTVAAAVAWFVLCAGISSGRPHMDRWAWAVPGAVRVGEYGSLIWIGATAGESGSAGAFAMVAALAFRHYELVYRPRFQGKPPPAWLSIAGGGWEGRLVLVTALLVVGALPGGLLVMAGVLAAVFVSECIVSWVRYSAPPVSIYEDEEDEGD